MSDSDDYDNEDGFFQTAEQSPIPDAVAPQAMLGISQWFAELFRVGATLNAFFQPGCDLGAGSRTKLVELAVRVFEDFIRPSHREIPCA